MGLNMQFFMHTGGYNSLHFSRKTFQKILACVCGNLCPFCQKGICGVRYWCWTRRPALQLLFSSTQRCSVGLITGLCAGHLSSFRQTPKTMPFMELAWCTVMKKRNLIAAKRLEALKCLKCLHYSERSPHTCIHTYHILGHIGKGDRQI